MESCLRQYGFHFWCILRFFKLCRLIFSNIDMEFAFLLQSIIHFLKIVPIEGTLFEEKIGDFYTIRGLSIPQI